MTTPPKALTLTKALDKMRGGSRLLVMCTNKSPEGKAFYVVPGGYIEPDDAQKIIARRDVAPYDDGLFPGIPQSWKMGAHRHGAT